MNFKKAIITSMILAACFSGGTLPIQNLANSYAEEAVPLLGNVVFSDEHHSENENYIFFTYRPVDANNSQIILKSKKLENIDINPLKEQLGESNIEISDNEKQIKLDYSEIIKKNESLKIKLSFKHNIETSLQFFNTNGDKIGSTIFKPNPVKTADESNLIDKTNDSDIKNETSVDELTSSNIDELTNNLPKKETPQEIKDENSDWTQKQNLEVSMGHRRERNGKEIIPVIYFGALNYALNHTSIKKSVGDRDRAFFIDAIGKGRYNNITAANSAIIVVTKGKNPLVGQSKDHKNYNYYTTTFADGDIGGNHNSYFGSQRNFVTTNIKNFANNYGNTDQPKVSGPDHVGRLYKNIGMDKGSAKFYIKKDPATGLDMQRMVFNQDANGYTVRISITQRFTQNGSVDIKTEFTNIGKRNISHFSGYTFRDITFMKDGDFNHQQSKSAMLSMGNHEGIYASRDVNDGRIEFKLNGFEDSPAAWSGRGTRSSFYSPEKTIDFPWGGDGKNEYPFYDVNDPGDKAIRKEAGQAWIDSTGKFENGISMHTKQRALNHDETISMTYQTKLIEKTDDIELRMYNENPHVLTEAELKNFKASGNWHHYKNNKVQIKYLIDDPDESAEHIIEKGIAVSSEEFMNQTDHDKEIGKLNDWEVNITDLQDKISYGDHKIILVAYDPTGKHSAVKEINIKKDHKATAKPQIKIDIPKANTSKKSPYTTSNNELTFGGFWSDLDSSKIDIYYKIDNGPKVYLHENINNVHGEAQRFNLENLDFQTLNRNDIHKITFSIDDHDPKHQPASDSFYFKHVSGSFSFIRPDKIKFGKHHVLPGESVKVHPTVEGRLAVQDYRDSNENPLKIGLTVKEFSTKNNPNQKLIHDLIWNGQPMKANQKQELFTGIKPNPNEWITVNDKTEEFENNLTMKFNNKNSVAQTGNYRSTWEWSICDSICN